MRISDWSSDVCSSDLRVAFVDESAGTVVGDVDEDFCLLAEISDIAQFPLASSAASLERLKRALRRNGCYRDAVGVAAVNPDRAGVVETDGEPFAWLCTSPRDPPPGVTPRRACRQLKTERKTVGKGKK